MNGNRRHDRGWGALALDAGRPKSSRLCLAPSPAMAMIAMQGNPRHFR